MDGWMSTLLTQCLILQDIFYFNFINCTNWLAPYLPSILLCHSLSLCSVVFIIACSINPNCNWSDVDTPPSYFASGSIFWTADELWVKRKLYMAEMIKVINSARSQQSKCIYSRNTNAKKAFLAVLFCRACLEAERQQRSESETKLSLTEFRYC